MAKGQAKGNKEAKKPRSETPKDHASPYKQAQAAKLGTAKPFTPSKKT